ncbi:hypothetical protein BKA65DRAFT_545357 [Rhexocercosporidium sp. MPI-PUGE-AT-0058]|nr:hypothetical protein BKA65DRAFT_545357 [Rhexocercosporidium sp. MPI-PUGE-AT-0058]
MCHIYDYSACGHRDIDRASCRNPNLVTDPCKLILTSCTLPSECSGCREAYLRTVVKRSSVMDLAREATRAALDFSTAPSLFAWPEKAVRKQKLSRRGPLSSDHLECIPESPTIVREERGWSPGLKKPLSCQPTIADTWIDSYSHVASAPPAPANAVSAAQQMESLPPSLTISIPQQVRGPPPQVITTPQSSIRAPPEESSTPQQLPRAPVVETLSTPPPIVRSRPVVDRSSNRLKPRDRSARLRDAFRGTETSHTPAVAPPTIKRKPIPSYPAWTTLPSQVGERTKEAGEVWSKTQTDWSQRQTAHTPTQELFLTTTVKEIQLEEGGLPSCLQPGDLSQANNLSRLSTIFNLFSETGRESSVECETREPADTATHTYTAYPGATAVKSTSEIPTQSYAAHEAHRNVSVEFVDRKPTAASTPTPTIYATYNPVPTMKGTSQFSAHVPIEFEAVASSRDRSLTIEKSLTEKSLSEISEFFHITPKSGQGSSVELVSASSARKPSTTSAITLNQAKSLSELSAIFDMETCEPQIELEAHSRLMTPAQHCKTGARLSTARSYDCYKQLNSTAELVSSSSETTIDSIPQHELPSFRPLSAMKFSGTALEGVSGNWSWSS